MSERAAIVSSPNVLQRIRRMMATIAEAHRKSNETRYQSPIIWRRGLRLQSPLRSARPADVKRRPNGSVYGLDDGRPAGMSGRQWKRLKRATRRMGTSVVGVSVDRQRECTKIINRAHELADRRRTQPGVRFRNSRPPWKRLGREAVER
jgi:hypothetical protein